mmetsp:Transcript_14103/g.30371  ORF Transcript_14103/g.30371 Transcript_14103/m.30371 type:complete len:294 (+) Transcript_14103:50-931(+)
MFDDVRACYKSDLPREWLSSYTRDCLCGALVSSTSTEESMSSVLLVKEVSRSRYKAGIDLSGSWNLNDNGDLHEHLDSLQSRWIQCCTFVVVCILCTQHSSFRVRFFFSQLNEPLRISFNSTTSAFAPAASPAEIFSRTASIFAVTNSRTSPVSSAPFTINLSSSAFSAVIAASSSSAFASTTSLVSVAVLNGGSGAVAGGVSATGACVRTLDAMSCMFPTVSSVFIKSNAASASRPVSVHAAYSRSMSSTAASTSTSFGTPPITVLYSTHVTVTCSCAFRVGFVTGSPLCIP